MSSLQAEKYSVFFEAEKSCIVIKLNIAGKHVVFKGLKICLIWNMVVAEEKVLLYPKWWDI